MLVYSAMNIGSVGITAGASCDELSLFTLQMDTAMMLHFNVLTPHHDHSGEVHSAQGLPPRPAKRNGSFTPSVDPASSADWYIPKLLYTLCFDACTLLATAATEMLLHQKH
jgi:hypothetical protein